MIDILEFRVLKGWSKEKLAGELGVSLSTIILWEKGTKPSRLAQEKIDMVIRQATPGNDTQPSMSAIFFPKDEKK